ncbi:ATP-dependent DNA ligase [Candidatus Bathyarchaeota archaeon]|nr:ATP-dependent DNA ligase [Candidatus Bathyarchaeota archaeon]
MEVDEYEVKVSSLDKIFYEKVGVTKGDMIDYYMKIFSTMEPHIAERPLTLHRYPDGVKGEDFYQKETPDDIPDYVETVEIEKKENGSQQQLLCSNKATLVYLANLGTIEFHIWLCRRDKLHHPDKLVFDLDPPGDDFEPVRDAAFDLKDMMEEIKLKPYVMTTGSDGLHVAASLDREHEFDGVRDFAEKIASQLAADNPKKYTTEIRKNKRQGRLFLDVARNAYGQTSVVPYSLRAREECSVATPLDWDELHDSDIYSRSYTIENIFQRLGQKDDPWEDFYESPSSLDKVIEKIENLE